MEAILVILVFFVALGLGYFFAMERFAKMPREEEIYSGEETKEEKEMMKSVLDLSDIEVYDVMNHRKNLFSLDIGLPLSEIVEKVKDCPFSRVPFYKDTPENIVGVLRVRELLKEVVNFGGDYSKININSLMSKPWFIPETTNLLQQLQFFRARREHFAIVVSEYGDLEGIVTLEDIIEEIVGDINDEYDVDSIDLVGIQESSDSKTFLIDGDVPVRDLNRKHGWCLCDENAVTLAGYLMDMTQTIPEQGQNFIFEGFEFKVIKREKNQLKKIRVRPEKKS